jgi:hypothetical protein
MRWLGALCLVLGAFAGAASATDLAVLSLAGQRLTIVIERSQTGTHLDANDITSQPLAGATLDEFIAGVAEAAIVAERANTQVTKWRAPEGGADAIGEGWVREGSAELRAVVERVAREAGARPGAQVLLVLPYRTEPELASYAGYRGTGRVAGLGFYVGWGVVNRNVTPGFLGVFANLQLALVDADTGRIVAHERVVAGETFAATLPASPWETLSADAKVAALTALVRREIERGVRALLASAG